MSELLGSLVSCTVPARPEYVHVLRAVTASVAARLDFPYDGIDDLRLAVDEACAHLLDAGVATDLRLRLTPLIDGVEVVVSVDAAVGSWPPEGAEGSLAWQVLSALADEASFVHEADRPSLRLVKRLGPPGAHDG